MGADGEVRGVRTVLPAAVAVLVALAGHLAAGGTMVSPLAVVALTIGATALAYALSARRWSPRTLTALVLLTQALVHLGCGLAPPGGTDAMEGMTHGVGPAAGAGPTMVLTHLAATAVTVAALAHGETLLAVVRHLLGLLGRAGHVLAIVAAPVPVAPPSGRQASRDPAPRCRAHARRGGLRGPPRAATVLQP